MLKQLFYLFLLSLLMGAELVFAHAVVTEDSLKIDPIHTGKPSQVSLVFNAKVELGLSKFYLVKEGDVHEPLSAKLGSKQGEVLVDIPALAEGEYAISLKVFAADGHLTEDVIRFFVIE